MATASMFEPDAGVAGADHSLRATDLLAWRRSMLQVEGSGPASPADLDWLLDLAGGVRWPLLQSLRLHPDRTVALARPLDELEALWRRHRRSSEPLQYLVGICPWRDLELSVAPGVLIPRQETEQLAALALALAPISPAGSPLLWADLGTGSGCLALAL
ncbi:MAG: protein-(glutamine-N5) methyltransferase, release factor-specific, partial [Cyanobium sp.]